MKRLLPIAGLLLCLAAPLFAQDNEPEVVLPDAVMKQVVSRIVTFYFKPRRTPTSIYVSNEGIRAEWMPNIRNIRFVLVKNEKYQSGRKGYVFSGLTREGDHYNFGLGYGDLGCGGSVSGATWNIKIVNSRVRLWPTYGNWGSACYDVGGSGS